MNSIYSISSSHTVVAASIQSGKDSSQITIRQAHAVVNSYAVVNSSFSSNGKTNFSASSAHHSEAISSVYQLSQQQGEQMLNEILLRLAQMPSPLENVQLLFIDFFLNQQIFRLFANQKGASLYSLLAASCPREKMIEWTAALLESKEALSSAQFQEIKEFLLETNPLYESTPFQLLMRRENGNQLFDRIIASLSDDDLNTHKDWQRQVLNFAFSHKRYEELFLGDEFKENLSTTFTPVDFSAVKKSKNYGNWLAERRKSSGTLTTPTQAQAKGINNWNRANEFILCAANKKQPIKMETIKTLHHLLTEGEVGVEHPGLTRDTFGGIVKISGSWRNLPCPPEKLRGHIRCFDEWLQEQSALCDQGKKDPILFAAQAYERFLSLHPFENGNGRTARFVMDDILEQYGILPPVLGEDVLHVIFPLKPSTKNTDLIQKIVTGIKTSYSMLNIT